MFELNEQKADVVFLGDSITARGRFEEFFPDVNLINRGIGSDTSEGVLHRLDEVTDRNPKKIFLMIGINDIGKKVVSEKIIENVSEILQRINKHDEECEIYLQSILPVTTADIKIIEYLNYHYKSLSSVYKNCTYVDLYSFFLSTDGNINKELISADGVHLNGKGYKVWINAISLYVYN